MTVKNRTACAGFRHGGTNVLIVPAAEKIASQSRNHSQKTKIFMNFAVTNFRA
jgi:hypothetical protein